MTGKRSLKFTDTTLTRAVGGEKLTYQSFQLIEANSKGIRIKSNILETVLIWHKKK